MMVVKDTRAKNNKANFADLPIGSVYEDAEGIICIKTSDAEYEDNCICFVRDGWEVNTEGVTTKVIPLKTTLLIER